MTAFVYVIEADNGEVKVGLSGTPVARLSKIKREYGARRGFKEARLVGYVRTPDPLLVEWLAHRTLAEHVTGGEWFRVDPMLAIVTVLQEAMLVADGAFVQSPTRRAFRAQRPVSPIPGSDSAARSQGSPGAR